MALNHTDMAMQSFRLTIDVDVELNGLKPADMLAELQAAAKYLFDEGRITNDTPAKVTRWTTEVGVDPPQELVSSQKYAQALEALEELIDTINATGGVFMDSQGVVCPKGDKEWYDLGTAYLKACTVLKRRPKLDRKYRDATP
jgi:hypothetical protein